MKIGFALCGSFCTFSSVFPVMELLSQEHQITPIFSFNAATVCSRFGNADTFIQRAEALCHQKAILTLNEAEPIGPRKLLDLLLIAPCTGNTLAKLAAGVADTPVTMASKSHLRNNRPVVIAVSTNDGLAGNAKNIGVLLDKKNIFFVPFGQDDFPTKPNSLVADFSRIPKTISCALQNTQVQPILIT